MFWVAAPELAETWFKLHAVHGQELPYTTNLKHR